MTYLELVKKLADETGTFEADEITGVTAPVISHERKLVDWVKQAWIEIQNESRDWLFMRDTVTLNVLDGVQEYDLTAIPRYEHLIPYTAGICTRYIVLDDKYRVRFIRYERWRGWRDMDRLIDRERRPRFYTVTPDDTLVLDSIPTESGELRFDIHLLPQELAVNADIPELPGRFHRMIVYHAIINYSGEDEAAFQMQRAIRQYDGMLAQLRRDQIPELKVG